MFRLKKNQPAIQVTDGPFAGRTFVHGRSYAEVPEAEAHRFERPSPVKKRTAKTVTEDDK